MSSFPQIDPSDSGSEPDPATTALWKDEVAERLAAHRSRRSRRVTISDLQDGLFTPAPEDPNRAARIAASIAARYARQPTYRELLEREEAKQHRLAEERAQAELLARSAALASATAVCEATGPEATAGGEFNAIKNSEPHAEIDSRRRYIETSHRVVLHAPMPAPMPPQQRPRASTTDDAVADGLSAPTVLEDLFSSVVVEPTVPLPAKLIEFPRELIATRKARPRMAEGPLLQEGLTNSGDPTAQLRIFEVEHATISHQPLPADSPSDAPIWSNMRLDDPGVPRWENQPQASPFPLPLQPAALSRRALAAAVDLVCVAAAMAGFAAVFFFSTTHAPMAKLGAEFGVGIFALLCGLYEWMFFTFAESTPGMRAARIALCTFDDTNPTRRAMRIRLGAVVLAACPLGLGFIWAIFDEDGLGWHDRIARMYQRSY